MGARSSPRKGATPSSHPPSLVLILGPHKSGSSLLRSLLDAHPQLVVLPIESHVAESLGLWTGYPLRWRYQLPTWRFTTARRRLHRVFARYASSTDALADAQYAIRASAWDYSAFTRDTPNNRHFGSRQRLAQDYLETAYQVFGMNPSASAMWVEKSVEHIAIPRKLIRSLPLPVKCLVISRDPAETIAALERRALKDRNKVGGLRRLQYIASLRRSRRGMRSLDSCEVDRLDIAYDSLVQDPRRTMEVVAEFLGIDWQESLLEPTNWGEPWEGNSSRGIAHHGVTDMSPALSPPPRLGRLYSAVITDDRYPHDWWRPSREEGAAEYLLMRGYAAIVWIRASILRLTRRTPPHHQGQVR